MLYNGVLRANFSSFSNGSVVANVLLVFRGEAPSRTTLLELFKENLNTTKNDTKLYDYVIEAQFTKVDGKQKNLFFPSNIKGPIHYDILMFLWCMSNKNWRPINLVDTIELFDPAYIDQYLSNPLSKVQFLFKSTIF